MGQYIRKIRVMGILDDFINWCSEFDYEDCERLLEKVQKEIDKLEVVHGVKVTLPPRNEEEMRCAKEMEEIHHE